VKVEFVFSNGSEKVAIRYELRSSSRFVEEWTSLFSATIGSCPIVNDEYSFRAFSEMDVGDVTDKLNSHIEAVNRYQPKTINVSPLGPSFSFGQIVGVLSYQNMLMKSDFPFHVVDSLICIGRACHSLLRFIKEGKNRRSSVIVRFGGRKRKSLEIEDYEEFALERQFGDMIVSRCETGFDYESYYAWKEIWGRKGGLIGSPTRLYSANCMLLFSEKVSYERSEVFKWLTAHTGLSKEELQRSGVGKLIIGSLLREGDLRGLSDVETVSLLSRFKIIDLACLLS